MSLTESRITELLINETTSITPKPTSFLMLTLLGGVLLATPSINEETNVYKITEIPCARSHILDISTWLDREKYYQPKTTLAKRLLNLRIRAISKGLPLLTEADIKLEVSLRRGEPADV